jgi:hypothetical protein
MDITTIIAISYLLVALGAFSKLTETTGFFPALFSSLFWFYLIGVKLARDSAEPRQNVVVQRQRQPNSGVRYTKV